MIQSSLYMAFLTEPHMQSLLLGHFTSSTLGLRVQFCYVFSILFLYLLLSILSTEFSEPQVSIMRTLQL